MPALKDLSFQLRTFLKIYPWRRIDPVPRSELAKPLSESRVALVTSGGIVAPDDAPFDESVKGGDFSYRVLKADADVQSLIESHRSDSFDHAGILADRNLAFPLDRLGELAGEDSIGEVAPRHLSYMGSITAPGRLIKFTAPEGAGLLVEDKVDAALMIPV